MKKKSFILYQEQGETFNALTKHKAGRLIKLIFSYVNGENPQIPEDLKPIFIPIRQQIDRNQENYEKVCKINKGNAEKRWGKEKQPQKNTKVYESMRPHANADDNDNDNDNDINTKKENTSYKKKAITKPLTPETKNKIWDILEVASVKAVAQQRRRRG